MKSGIGLHKKMVIDPNLISICYVYKEKIVKYDFYRRA